MDKLKTLEMNIKILNIIVKGIAILIDFDRNIYTIKPAIKHAIAVRVPVGNIAHADAKPMIRKAIRCFLILLVIPKIIKATAVEAMPIPKFAASPKIEKYRISVPFCIICVVLPGP